MSALGLVILFLVLASTALFIVSVINARQTRRKLVQQRLLQQRRKVADLEELAIALESLCGNTHIALLVFNEITDQLRGMIQLSPNSQSLDYSLNNALTRSQEIQAPNYHCKLQRLQESDAQIARAQFLLSEAGRVVRKRQTLGDIEVSQMNHYIAELAWARLMVGVISMTGQGHLALRRGNLLRAHAYYRKAQHIALESPISDERKHQFVRELGELLSDQRQSISENLMPETQCNPNSNAA